MDSLTQFALGASVGVAVLGRRVGARGAAIAGGVLGTLPDLDSFIPAADAVERFVSHRGATHALLVQALATPVLGEALRAVVRDLRDARGLAWLAVGLCLSTHALLDAITIYGTRLLWPVWPEPVGLGSLFIIDPLYTLPLAIATLWALVAPGRRARAGAALALGLSTAYVGWALAAQHVAASRAEGWLRDRGVEAERLIATPTPFNTLFWRVIAVDGPRYFNIYVPLLGGANAISAHHHVRVPADLACWAGRARAEPGGLRTLAGFTRGFYSLELDGESVVFADLRMGLAPSYSFRFEVARRTSGDIEPVEPPRRVSAARVASGDIEWLLEGIAGARTLRPAERAHALAPDSSVPARPPPRDC